MPSTPSPPKGGEGWGEGGTRKVVLFYDLFLNHNRPDLGIKAIEKLESLGVEVALPPQRPCGYPFIAYGDLDAARDVALDNLRLLAPWVEAGYTILATEPTAAYTLAVSYPKLLPQHPHAKAVAEATREFFEYLCEIDPATSDRLKGQRYGFHCACHQRPLGSGEGAKTWLARHGADTTLIETGTCCGMAGTFGLKQGPLGYDLANAVGEPLFKLFHESGTDAIVTESSVCGIHLAEGTGMPVVHPLELL